ncbi:MAG: hypothetical protein Q4G27_08310 [Flavobacteriaceae bacterium]|nr:hypothetical protein [Flavobacteriaceae bacterium]
MKYLLLLLLPAIIACKNPWNKSEDSPADFAIQNTEDGKVLLRLKPQVGEKSTMQMKVELKPMGMLPMNTTIIADLNMRVVSSTDSAALFHIDFQRMQMNATILGAKINYDSQGDNSNIPAEIKNQIEPFLAKKFSMEMDTLARVTKLEIDQSNSIGSNIDLNALFIPLPENEVGTGDSWTTKQDVQSVQNAELIYTIDRISATEVLVKVNQSESETSKISGQYLLDRKTGFTKDGIIEIQTNQGGQNIQLKITVDTLNSIK